ncbi:Transcriptional protein SWT1 [Cyberlindnera fabianii]|uniref:Transcriptional protein SWT1 n=1 Tax=Cyberlindnera fabianii TaxID=36022 RepID=A0A1V2L655_CYBFA|nr:Transcriptional protein SWT1 [Cyberlindnera fabianii]
MGELPSKYSDAGLSEHDQKRVITVGEPRHKRPIGAIKIEKRVQDELSNHETSNHSNKKHADVDTDGDIPMIGMDDEEEVQIITDYVTGKRETIPSLSTVSTRAPSYERDEVITTIPVQPQLKRQTYLVLDTNFMISHLDIVDKLAKLHTQYHHVIVIPLTVVKELDGLKESSRTNNGGIDGVTVGHLARWANDWIYAKLANMDKSVRGQKLREKLEPSAVKDDAILDCSLYLKEKENALVVLLSNDKNLCMKALTNEVLTVSYRKGMTAELISQTVFEENRMESPIRQESIDLTPVPHVPQLDGTSGASMGPQPTQVYHNNQTSGQPDHGDMEIDQESTTSTTPQSKVVPLTPKVDFSDASEQVFKETQKVVLDCIDYCMNEEYGEDGIELIGYTKSKVLTLRDAAETLIKYWVSVFTEYFTHSSFTPFNRRGKRTPRFTGIPVTQPELKDFVEYWSEVLTALYVKRNEKQNEALEKIIKRWKGFANAHYVDD